MSVQDFFSSEEQGSIVASIQKAESRTSGEIRVHLDKTCSGDPYQRAIKVFENLNMHKTVLRNGVLFYLSVKDKKIAILGDKGIDEKVPPGFWNNILERMISRFKTGEMTEGLVEAIQMAGEQLSAFFPYQKDDRNELSNDLSFDDQ